MDEEEEELVMKKKKSEAPPPRRKPKKMVIPRRKPSVVIPPKLPVYITADKTVCEECTCFPKTEPYVYPKKLNPCQKSPETLYHLAAAVVDSLVFPPAFTWTEDDVVMWFTDFLGLPEYTECINDNHINGMRLLMLEDPSKLAEINIRNFDHIQFITSCVRALYGTDFLRFARSVGLPPRKPLTHCTWFKSRSGPSWGIRQNWTRCDILRWMKMINPEPPNLDHWDLVWYQRPEFPTTKFARIGKAVTGPIPHYKPQKEICTEYLVPRKFRFQTGISESQQLIWMERPRVPERKEKKKVKKVKKKVIVVPKETRLFPKKISLTGLNGKDLVLARRKMPKPKFLP
ncbi:uncharacterized protein [Epargyreus clarus]|uniref:uncharacterized protein n=1 Tax=Epargyreus clarus TaxID=520877 RepID=UPI003C2EDA37